MGALRREAPDHVSGAVLTSSELAQTGDFLRAQQESSGFIPWFVGGHGDPWNHVEAAMALSVLGDLDSASRAYEWMARHQLGEGAWFNYYRGDAVENPRLDTNVSAYVAVGVFLFAVVSEDRSATARWWPMVDRALDFALSLQRPDGAIRWSLDSRGRAESDALLTGCSSLLHSLECGVALAESLGHRRDHWRVGAANLRHALRGPSEAFAAKDEFAMDWYYPVLVGALSPESGRARLNAGRTRFVIEGEGVRCVSSSDWVTAAETAECALAWTLVGDVEEARTLLGGTRRHRRLDGSYLTGLVEPGSVSFPTNECTTYSAAAVVLSNDALSELSPVRRCFRVGLDLSL